MAPRKPADRRQGRGTSETVIELVPGGVLAVPDSPDRWLPETASEWASFWSDPELTSIVRETQRPALVRLFDWRDRLRRAWDQADELREAVGDEHFIEGSTGQPRANPLYDQAEKAEARALQIEGRVEALEDRFGLTPAALLKLGVNFQKRQSLEQLNAARAASLNGGTGDRNADGSRRDDPRALPGDTAARSS